MADVSDSKTLNVIIEGSGPYGFRLSGGDGEPMTITKLRRQGKAHHSGLHEGDTVLGINGFSCQTLSHSAAMGLLESSVQSVQLLVFRGPPEALSSAYDEVGSQLRSLPPGAAPKPRVLPPPPSGETGSLVIDQPSFTRPFSERFVVDEPPHQHNGHANETESAVKMIWQPSKRAAPPASLGARQPWTSEFDSSDSYPAAAAPADHQTPGGWSTGVWQNGPSQTPARWTPHHHLHQPINGDEAEMPEFRAPSTDPKKPWMWKPPVTFQTASTTNTHEESVSAWQQASLKQNEQDLEQDRRHPRQQQQQQQQQPRGEDQADGLPKWALPLRSDYDWRKSYPSMVDEHVVFAEDDEWEYGYTNEGELVKRKKKIFADSSFYDDPNHKYPTIEEQIKMARKVAQSLTAVTNVSARGQRMFLRRREKADRWIVSELPPPTMAVLLRRGVLNGAEYQESAPARAPVYEIESDSEMLYYNPAPWQRPVGRGSGSKATAPEQRSKTPTSGARLPWKSDFDISSSAAAVFRSPSPTGVQHKWQPAAGFAATDHGSRRDTKDTPAPRHPTVGKTSFNISKELRQMKGKGGQMFAKRRAQAAEEERRDEDYTDSGPAVGFSATEADVGRDQPYRLLDLIEKTRATSPGRQWAASTPNIAEHTVDPAVYGTFSPEVKTRGSFRPVKFRVPNSGSSQAAIDSTPGGISDF